MAKSQEIKERAPKRVPLTTADMHQIAEGQPFGWRAAWEYWQGNRKPNKMRMAQMNIAIDAYIQKNNLGDFWEKAQIAAENMKQYNPSLVAASQES